jgi:hypothetical protein
LTLEMVRDFLPALTALGVELLELPFPAELSRPA